VGVESRSRSVRGSSVGEHVVHGERVLSGAMVEALETEMRPLGYRELARIVWSRIGYVPRADPEPDYESIRQIAKAERAGLGYVPKPLALAYMRYWFDRPGWNVEAPIVLRPGESASEWFRAKWPELYRSDSTRAFRIRSATGREYQVEFARQHSDETVGDAKSNADIYVVVDALADCVRMRGFSLGDAFRSKRDSIEIMTRPMSRLIVAVNSMRTVESWRWFEAIRKAEGSK
jgi:hypothetical protein